MEIPARNDTFTYQQEARTGPDGRFSMTVPYSTTGYEEYGPSNGHTNVSVRANGSYQLRTGITRNESGDFIRYNGTVDVTERQVLGESQSPAEVDLERTVVFSANQSTNPNGTDSGSGSETDSGSDSGTETGTDSGSDTGTGTPAPTATPTEQPSGTDAGTDTSGDDSPSDTPTGSSAVEPPSGDGLDLSTVVPLVGVGLVSLVFASRQSRS
jgi:dolichyl-diphosphooligosaccharide--protein glycosyltransferase